MRCNHIGATDTTQEFIALRTCGVWGTLLSERQPRNLSGLQLIREPADEDCHRFALLLSLWSGHFHCFDSARRKSAAENQRDSSEKSRVRSTRLDSSLTAAAVCDRRPMKMFGACRAPLYCWNCDAQQTCLSIEWFQLPILQMSRYQKKFSRAKIDIAACKFASQTTDD